MTEGMLQSEVDRLQKVICMLTNVDDDDLSAMADEQKEFLEGVKKEMRGKLLKKHKAKKAAIEAMEREAEKKKEQNGDSDFDSSDVEDGNESDGVLSRKPAARKSRVAAASKKVDDDESWGSFKKTCRKKRPSSYGFS